MRHEGPGDGWPRVVSPFVDGRLVAAHAEAEHEVVNPSTGRPILTMSAGSATDVDHAVRSARAVFESGHWSEQAPSLRKKVLHRLADLIEQEAAGLDGLDA